MSYSIFTLELAKIDYTFITNFVSQQIPEGQRIEYKEQFPTGLKLEETICSFGNSFGGMLFVGIKADKKTNKPIGIPGIPLTDQLEETVINRCLSNINPPLIPEVKICEFNSNTKAVIFIRVPLSYRAPHEIIRINRIMIRIHNRNSTANLNDIERLLKRREQISMETSSVHVHCNYKHVETDNDHFESVVTVPKYIFSNEQVIYFNKQSDDWLKSNTNIVGYWNDLEH